MAKEHNKREEYVVKIGPLLKKALESQREKIKKALYNVDDSSDYTAGEIIAKKGFDAGLFL